jgi:hypothetical protein
MKFLHKKPPKNGGWSFTTIQRIAWFIQYIRHTPTVIGVFLSIRTLWIGCKAQRKNTLRRRILT